MFNWIRVLLSRNGQGGEQVEVCEGEKVTKKNVGSHSKRITTEMRRIDREFDIVLGRGESEAATE